MKTKSLPRTNVITINAPCGVLHRLPIDFKATLVGSCRMGIIYGGSMSKDRGRLTDVPYRNWLPKDKVKQHDARVDKLVKVTLAALAIGSVLIIIWSFTDKRNEVRNAKIFKNQVLAYLPASMYVNFPNPEVSR